MLPPKRKGEPGKVEYSAHENQQVTASLCGTPSLIFMCFYFLLRSGVWNFRIFFVEIKKIGKRDEKKKL